MSQYTIERVDGDEFYYRGWEVNYSTTVGCDCCGSQVTLTWDAVRWVDGKLCTIYSVATMQEMFAEIDRYMEGESENVT